MKYVNPIIPILSGSSICKYKDNTIWFTAHFNISQELLYLSKDLIN